MTTQSQIVDKKFSIQFAANQSGLSVHTIRAWEKRYQAIIPERDSSGRRQYSRAEIDRLKKMCELTKLGNAISEIANLNDDELGSLYNEYIANDNDGGMPVVKREIDITITIQNLMLALYGFKLDIISHEFEKIKEHVTPKDLALKILMPLLNEINDAVYNGRLDKSQQQAIFSSIKFHVGHTLYQHMCRRNCSPFSFTIVAPEHERNEFSTMLAALLCCHHNIRFYYLGVDLGAASLVKAVEQIKSEYIYIGVTKEVHENYTHGLKDFVSDVRAGVNPNVKIWINGMTPIVDRPLDSTKFVDSFNQLDEQLALLRF